MILEDETFEAFGYYPSKLTHGSSKPILAACELCEAFRVLSRNDYRLFCKSCVRKDKNNSMYDKNHTKEAKTKISTANKGRHRSEKSKSKQSASIKGEKNHNFNKHLSEKTKAKMSAAHKGKTGEKSSGWRGGPVKCICQQCKKNFKVWPCILKNGKGKYCSHSCFAKAQRHNAQLPMTAPEKAFEAICIKNKLPFKFVGDGSLDLGRANPDFVHDTKKIVVEVNGDYWHSPLLNRNLRYTATVPGRRKQFKAEGYKCIIIWETDLKRKDAEAFVLYLMHNEKII
jgi:G:T-mismatch repair DNA endonuclease (very short patch repair protein)